MTRTHSAALLLTAILSTGSAILSAQTRDKSCCEMKIVAAADAPARLTVTITNVNAPILGVVRTRPDRDFGISVKTDTGGEVGLTEEGKRLLHGPYMGRQAYEEYKPGESVSEELDLGRIFELRPGAYRVTLTHEVYVGGVKSGAKVYLESTIELKIP
jgi:hypothetical protein